jgi:uroporphyrinogen decarboxylase
MPASTPVVQNSTFLRACRGSSVESVPVWFMRQAGRALPEYHRTRGDRPFFETLADPEMAAEITLQPVRRYGVDAAILFSDIVVPLAATGVGVKLVPGTGPVVEQPFRRTKDLSRLRRLEPEEDMPYVLETVRILARELTVPLIGLAGGPFTLASYLIEGGPSRDNHARAQALMYAEPALWSALLDALADLSLEFLRAQVAAGASAVQLFDSWVGSLSATEYRDRVMPASAKVLDGLADLGVPRIHFGVGTGHLVGLMAAAGADVVGVDWRLSLSDARTLVGPGRAVQGNLNPAACFAPWELLAAEASRVIADARPETGYVFNLGHGVLPDTDPDVLTRLVELVHNFESSAPA